MGKEKEEEITKLREKGLEEVVEVGAGCVCEYIPKNCIKFSKI